MKKLLLLSSLFSASTVTISAVSNTVSCGWSVINLQLVITNLSIKPGSRSYAIKQILKIINDAIKVDFKGNHTDSKPIEFTKDDFSFLFTDKYDVDIEVGVDLKPTDEVAISPLKKGNGKLLRGDLIFRVIGDEIKNYFKIKSVQINWTLFQF